MRVYEYEGFVNSLFFLVRKCMKVLDLRKNEFEAQYIVKEKNAPNIMSEAGTSV